MMRQALAVGGVNPFDISGVGVVVQADRQIKTSPEGEPSPSDGGPAVTRLLFDKDSLTLTPLACVGECCNHRRNEI